MSSDKFLDRVFQDVLEYEAQESDFEVTRRTISHNVPGEGPRVETRYNVSDGERFATLHCKPVKKEEEYVASVSSTPQDIMDEEYSVLFGNSVLSGAMEKLGNTGAADVTILNEDGPKAYKIDREDY